MVFHVDEFREEVADEEAAEEAVAIASDLTHESYGLLSEDLLNLRITFLVVQVFLRENSLDCDGILEEWSALFRVFFMNKIQNLCVFILLLWLNSLRIK